MSRIKRARPSPAIVVAVLALVAALGGSAVAEQATTAGKNLNKKQKKQVRKISDKRANKQIDKAEPNLSVGDSAKLDGKELLAVSVAEDGSVISGSPGITSEAGNVTGTYNLTFPKPLGECEIVASPQVGSQLTVDEAQGTPGDDRVGILTRGSTGTLSTSKFDVLAFC